MPHMSLSKKISLLMNFVQAHRFKEIYNMFWIYPLWWNRKLSAFLLNKLFPKFGIDLYPPFLEIEPTTVCNMNCVICEHTYWKEPSVNMTFEQFKHIVDQFPNLKWLGLTGIGSSYLNKDFHKMLAYSKSKGTIIEIMDHFNHSNEQSIRELVDIGPDFFFVSVYGTNDKTYKKVCPRGTWTKAYRNIKLLAKIKKESNSRFPILNFHFIVSKYTKPEILKFIDIVHSLNTEVGEILITPLLHEFTEIKDLCTNIDDRLAVQIDERARQYGIPITYNRSSEKTRLPIRCCMEYIMPFIFVTGHVIPCCGTNEANKRDYQKKTAMGNIFEQRFRDIWYGERYINLRKKIRQNKVPLACIHCPNYMITHKQ